MVQIEGGAVKATLNYAGQFAGRGVLDTRFPERSNIALEPHEVSITDIRSVSAGTHSLAVNGFEFTRIPSDIVRDPELFQAADQFQFVASGLMADYTQEMCAFLRNYVGANRVIPQVSSFLARTSARAKTRTKAGTADLVHLDYTQSTADIFLDLTGQATPGGLPPHQHYAFFQTWRALSPGPQDNTLAICDGASVPYEDGIEIDARMGPAEEPGKNFPFRICRYRPGHQWYYLSDMTPDDVILFKGFDSRQPRSMNAMHSAFDNPVAGDESLPRHSIEARFIAFF
jgi:hypothetical protein